MCYLAKTNNEIDQRVMSWAKQRRIKFKELEDSIWLDLQPDEDEVRLLYVLYNREYDISTAGRGFQCD